MPGCARPSSGWSTGSSRARADAVTARARGRRPRAPEWHEPATAMPGVGLSQGSAGNAVYEVGGKSFVFFRNPRPDAVDPETGERYDDVIVVWVPSEAAKLGLGR